MAFNRAFLYNHKDQLTSMYARAIGHPARILILRQLFKSGTCTVEELLTEHPLSQPSLSQHLRILRQSGLIRYFESYPYTYYSVSKENLKGMKKQMKKFLDAL